MKEGKRINRDQKYNKKSRENIEKKKKMITRTFFSIIILIVFAIIAYIANDYIILDKNKTTNLVINNKNVTSNLKKEIIIEDDIIYMSKQDLSNFFDKYIYEEKENNKIITTYDKKVAEIGFEENTIKINGTEKDIYAHAIKRDETIYLPISEMKDVYNIEIENIQETKVLTIDSINREQKKALVASNAAVKSSTKFIAKTLDRIKKGEYVIVIENLDNGYSKIRTENGKIGYIKTKKIVNEYTVRQNLETENQITGKVNLVWDYFSEVASAPSRTGTSIDGINVVSPSFFYLDKNGNLKENVGTKGKEYIQWANDNGYKIWPMVSNASAGIEITSEIMNSYEKRQKLIEQIISVCVEYELDGINIDFENMKKEDVDLYSRFIIELTPRIKEIGLTISVDVTAPDGSDTWSLCFDRNVIGDVADYIVFMAYDQYGASSTKAGTTAGYNWVELSLKKFIETEEIDSDKIILAMPFYTRLWTEDEQGKITKKPTVDMKNIETVLPDNVEKTWDDELKQYYVEYKDGNYTKKMWIEDLESLRHKVSLVKKYELGGIASWQKGMEIEEVWQMYKEEFE